MAIIGEASVGEISRGRFTKSHGKLVVCMRLYPRFLKRTLVHDYEQSLSPPPELFKDFRAALARTKDHNLAFAEVNYEERFELSAKGWEKLRELAELSRTRDVYLICQCERNAQGTECCHRHLLMIMAEEFFGAARDRLRCEYPAFEKRIREGRLSPPKLLGESLAKDLANSKN